MKLTKMMHTTIDQGDVTCIVTLWIILNIVRIFEKVEFVSVLMCLLRFSFTSRVFGHRLHICNHQFIGELFLNAFGDMTFVKFSVIYFYLLKICWLLPRARPFAPVLRGSWITYWVCALHKKFLSVLVDLRLFSGNYYIVFSVKY